ncbi:MAG TPA: 50S ribosomal protein L21 [Terriglobales bacterium]|nr:50S ribosomal protein L21 [Terriglobales bacterium]
MYAVIRAGGKQFRVAPGDVIRVDQKPAENGNIEFTDVLAVSGEPGALVRPQSGARVVGSVVEEGRGDKILVFHFKRKKQYKKLQGHRQPFTAVRITEIAFDGQKFTAPDQPAAKPKKEKKEMASKQTEQKAEKKSRTGAEGKASKGSKARTDKGTTRAAKKSTKKK